MFKKQIIEKLYEACVTFDAVGISDEFKSDVRDRIECAVTNNKPLEFVTFTCSTINSEYLFSSTPWLYVSLSPQDNNLTPDIARLDMISKTLKEIYPLVKITVIIGNTDPYYIYLQQPKLFLWKKYSERWKKYRNNLAQWINRSCPAADIQVLGWYEIEKSIEKDSGISFEKKFESTKDNILTYFSQTDLGWELSKLKTQFGPKKYFPNLKTPSDSILKDWVVRKFAEYATQALWVYEQFPLCILIQNEKPSFLRSKMYQPLVQEIYKKSFPVVYFCGVDNEGFR